MRWIKRISEALKTIASILAIFGVITFSCFIYEEAIQMSVYSTWQAKSSNNWALLKKGANTADALNTQLKWLNLSIGWINPFAFLSYRGFSQATDVWVESTHAMILANEAQLFSGEEITIEFKPERVWREAGYNIGQNGKIRIKTDQNITPGQWSSIRGIILTEND